MNIPKTTQPALRYSASIPSRPHASLAGWFEKRSGLWSSRRWLELVGSTLTYRHTPRSQPVWIIDLREYRVVAGRTPLQIFIYRAGAPLHDDAFCLYALTIGELKVWFSEMKRVSDNIHDFYHVSVQISHGSEGPIRLGRDRRTDEAVAIWTHNKAAAPLQRVLLLTRRDDAILNAVQSHNRLLSVYDVFETTRKVYTVTELITGGPLHDRIKPNGIGYAGAKMAIRDILNALAHLHSRGIIHGDVNSRNIVCTHRQLPCHVKLIAVGCALARQRKVSPTGASDILAAGFLLSLLLTGSEGTAGMLSDNDSHDIDPTIPSDARDLLSKMTDEDPKKRPSANRCLKHPWLTDQSDEEPIRKMVKSNTTVTRSEMVDYKKVTAIMDNESECSSAELCTDKSILNRRSSDPNTVIMDFDDNSVTRRHELALNNGPDT